MTATTAGILVAIFTFTASALAVGVIWHRRRAYTSAVWDIAWHAAGASVPTEMHCAAASVLTTATPQEVREYAAWIKDPAQFKDTPSVVYRVMDACSKHG